MPRKPSIIVEGADASGKSTLVTKLSDHFGIYPFRAGPKPIDMEHAEICMLYQTTWLEKSPCVWDRFTGISNVCNLPEITNQADLIMHASYVKRASQAAVIVVCTAQDISKHEPEPNETQEDIDFVYKNNHIIRANYTKFAHDFPHAIGYDYNVMSLDSLVRRIEHAYARHIQRSVH